MFAERWVKCGMQNALLNGLKTDLKLNEKKTLKKYVTNFFVYRYHSVELICFCLRKYKKELHDIHKILRNPVS